MYLWQHRSQPESREEVGDSGIPVEHKFSTADFETYFLKPEMRAFSHPRLYLFKKGKKILCPAPKKCSKEKVEPRFLRNDRPWKQGLQ